MNPKTYLGDSVYATLDDFRCLVLTTENGLGPSNRIVLESETWEALVRFVASLKQGEPQ